MYSASERADARTAVYDLITVTAVDDQLPPLTVAHVIKMIIQEEWVIASPAKATIEEGTLIGYEEKLIRKLRTTLFFALAGSISEYSDDIGDQTSDQILLGVCNLLSSAPT